MHQSRRGDPRGFTLVELLITISVIAILVSIAVPKFQHSAETDRMVQVTEDIRAIAFQIDLHEAIHMELPDSLPVSRIDPWGHPYRYTKFARDTNAKRSRDHSEKRKNKFLVPINTDYDLWSMGPDGASQLPLQSKTSRDDIVRANDGHYIGPAAEY